MHVNTPNTHAVVWHYRILLALWLFSRYLALSLGAAVSSPARTCLITTLLMPTLGRATRVYDSKGGFNIADFYLQQRRSVTLDRISHCMLFRALLILRTSVFIPTVVLTPGVSRHLLALCLVAAKVLPLLQQLVRNTVLSTSSLRHSLSVRSAEAYISIQMEKKFTKTRFLICTSTSFTTVWCLRRIEAASIIYFNKHASD